MRLEGWDDRLWAILERARTELYVLGQHDCFRVACEVVEALTGVNRWPEFSGYTTKREAMAKLAAHGSNFEAAGDWFFAVPRSDVRMARRGDLVCVETVDGEKHLGVCLGRDTALLAPDGLIHIPTLTCLCAWRVG